MFFIVLIILLINSEEIFRNMDILKIRKTRPPEVAPPPPPVVPTMDTWFLTQSTPTRKPRFIDQTTPMAPGNLHIVVPPTGDIYIPPAGTIASRQTGAAPLAIFFDATGVTTPATIYPFHECYFLWNFGDPTSGIWSTNGKSKNLATGGIAAHVFETAGDYTVTLTVIDSTGSMAVRYISIHVIAANEQWAGTKTICFSTSNNFEGAPDGSTHVYTSDWNIVKSYLAADRRLLFRRGETWYISGGDTYGLHIESAGPGMIGVFGSGVDKANLSKGPNQSLITVSSSDWRICDINAVGTCASFPANDNDAYLYCMYGNYSDVLVLRATDLNGAAARSGLLGANVGQDPSVHDKFFFVDSRFLNGSTQGFMGSSKRFVWLGTEVGNFGAHILRVSWTDRFIIQACYLHDQGHDFYGGSVLKLHDDWGYIGVTSSRWIQISDSVFVEPINERGGGITIEPQANWDGSNYPGLPMYPGTCEYFEDAVIERNFIITSGSAIRIGGLQRGTIRNNIIRPSSYPHSLMRSIEIFKLSITNEFPPDHIWVYNNTVYSNRIQDEWGDWFSIAESDGNGTNLIARNNYASAPNITNKHMFNDPYGVSHPEYWSILSNNDLLDSAGFVDPNNDNFHLAAGSSAIDSGYNVTTNYDDKEGTRRSGTFEKGAYQY